MVNANTPPPIIMGVPYSMKWNFSVLEIKFNKNNLFNKIQKWFLQPINLYY